ncbi:MAG: RDD family protein [Bdellovibrio sp.]|nr:RDD family protein [Bdellovibrio sp.]
MVYQDFSSRNEVTEQHKKFLSPVILDRFFSFLIDYLVLSPFVSFFTYLLFHEAIAFWRANPDAPEQVSLISILAVSVVFLFSFFQAVFIYLWQATPGQYFLKIQIHFEHGNLIFWRALLRQMGFWSSAILLGLPWLAIFTHPQRKTFYDRLADCQVVTFKKDEGFSFENESKYWQSLLATLILFVGFLFAAVMYLKYEKIIQRVASFKQLEKQNFFCEELKDTFSSNRLQVAIAMNVVGQLSNNCLDREADFVLWKEKTSDTSLAYFAKSLTEPNEEIEQSYLVQACRREKDASFADSTFGCQLARTAQGGDYETMYLVLRKHKNILADTYRYEFSRLLNKDSDLQKNFTILQKYTSHNLVKKYLLSEMLEEKSSAGGRSPASDHSIFDESLAKKWIDEL